ncbi:MAG: DUF2283 domain-containing protein [Anaerolineae bacterium]
MTKPDWLVEKEITLDDGSVARWSYDTEGDMLEIFFAEGQATCTVELADGVFLRLDLEKPRPLSLGFVSFTPLTQSGEFGPPALRLDGLESLPEDLRRAVAKIITAPPISSVLQVFSYRPSPRAKKPVPVACVPQQLAA